LGYYTGRSLGRPSTTSGEYSTEGTYQYNVVEGMLASTSGNIYGIYDISGGAYEYTAAWNTDAGDTNNYISSYGSSFASKKEKSTKYATAYHNETDNYSATSANCILGDATYETYNWFSDYSHCVNSTKPFFSRGDNYKFGMSAGVFYSFECVGYSSGYDSFRIVVPRHLAI